MIIGSLDRLVSPIALSVLLIVYLMIVELGNEKVRRILLPIVVVLMILFALVFVQNIASKW